MAPQVLSRPISRVGVKQKRVVEVGGAGLMRWRDRLMIVPRSSQIDRG